MTGNFSKIVTVDDVPVRLILLDTAGQESYRFIRPLSYPKTDLFLVCFSVDNLASLENVESKWLPEIKRHSPRSKITLVGLKSDLPHTVKGKVAEKLAKKAAASTYLECSAKTQEGIYQLFDHALKTLMTRSPPQNQISICRCS